jgi:hypothetical protein
MKRMKDQLKKLLDHNNRSGTERKTNEYYDDLLEILGDRPAVNPNAGTIEQSPYNDDVI